MGHVLTFVRIGATLAILLSATNHGAAKSNPGESIGSRMRPTAIVSPVAHESAYAFEEDEAIHASVLAVYGEAGLELPPFVVEFSDDDIACRGNSGLHGRSADGGSIVTICYTHDRPDVRERIRHATMMHEAAHVWIAHNVSDAQEEAFLELRGLESWRDREVAWGDRGTEEAAETLFWGVTGGDHRVITGGGGDVDALAEAFAVLTGQ